LITVFAAIAAYFSSLQGPTRGDEMFQYVFSFLGSAYIELIIFIVLLTYFVIHRHDKRLVVSGISLLKVVILLVIFIYFAWMPIVWPSLIPSLMLALSVFGMFVINFYLLYSVMLSRIERPYRDALASLDHDPAKDGVFQNIWTSGKRFYYYYYIFQALVSGSNPWHFLKEIANDRVQDDIKDTLRHMGVEKKLISLKLMVGYLKNRLSCDTNLPADFKDVMTKTIDEFDKHPWLEEQINEFLRIATESPEDLHFPEWMAAFEKCVNGYK
jgi:hypothetical protein